MSDEKREFELIQLWLMAHEGLASDDDLNRLSDLLEGDADARKLLIQITRQQGWLFWNGIRSPGIAAAALAAGQTDMESHAIERVPSVVKRGSVGQSRAALRESIGSLSAIGNSVVARLRRVRFPLLSFRMATLAGCIAIVAWWIGSNRPLSPFTGAAMSADGLRAEIVDATLCVWSGGPNDGPVLGQHFREGDTLQLLEGMAELRVASSGLSNTLQLEGPVAIELGRNGISNLRYGKVAIQTSPAGGDFQIATSFGRVVVPPGSEVGISTFGNSAEVHVFEGIASLESPWLVSEEGELMAREIVAGSALRFSQAVDESLQASTIAADRGLFTTRLSMDANFLPVKPDYVQAIHDARPICYWRFETVDGNRVPNEMGSQFEGQLRGDFRTVGPSGNQAIELGVAPNPGSMQVEQTWNEVLEEDFSLEFWMRPSHYHVGTVIGFVGPFDWKIKKNPYGIVVEVQGGWGDGSRTNRVRFLHRSPLSMFTRGNSIYSDPRYATRRWQHVAAMREGTALKLYLDGKLVQSGRDETTTPPDLQIIVGQLYTDAVDRPFIGYLDEIAIYDRALFESEVRDHYQRIRSEAKPLDSI